MDLLVCSRFAEADVIGSAGFDAISGTAPPKTDLEHRYVDSVHPHSAIARRSLVVSRGWPDRMPGAGDAMRDWSRQGVRIFSGSATNFRADPALGLPRRAHGHHSRVGCIRLSHVRFAIGCWEPRCVSPSTPRST